jgi:DUF4097 and DUF4098 domain-containing protein YvlB
MKSLITLLACSVLAVAASAKVTEKFAQTYPFDASGSIRVENVNGTVEIIAWDKPEVALEAVKTAREQDGLDRMHLKIEATTHELSIKTELEKKWKFWDNMNAQVRYKLMVPAGVTLERISVVNANIEVTGVKGRVNLQSVNGGIKAREMTSDGTFGTVNGSVEVEYGALSGRPEIELETVNGSCSLKLPATAAFDLDADTVNGHISCDFPITLTKSGRHELRGSVNGGGARVELDSVNGGLSVSKG